MKPTYRYELSMENVDFVLRHRYELISFTLFFNFHVAPLHKLVMAIVAAVITQKYTT